MAVSRRQAWLFLDGKDEQGRKSTNSRAAADT